MQIKQENEPGAPWWQPAIIIFARISTWVVVPIVLALYIGKYLDKKYGTNPWIFLILTGIAFIISILGILIQLRKYIKDMNIKDADNNKNGKSNESK